MIKQKANNYTPDFVVHPGVTLSETLGSIGMSQTELAKRISRPEKAISEIINGSKSITPETAIQLERALGVPASFWNNLEKNYQELKAKTEAKSALTEEVELADKYPYSEMAKNGWLQPATKWEEKIENLLSFFAVDKLSLIDNVMPAVFRQHNGRSVSPYSIQAWLRKGLIDNRNINTQPFDKQKLDNVLNGFRSLSNEKPSIIVNRLTTSLSECGIALIFTQDLPNTYVCGAARWITPEKAMIQLSLRGSYADIMWFTFYHELGHLLLHSKKKHFVDLTNKNNGSEEEKEADKFASEQLIPNQKLSDFVSTKEINAISIKEFANELNIHPGIIVGRLKHEKIIKYKDFNHLRAKYRFVNT
ncbi:MAG: HigA family addiction module antitoxin [Candidatus Marinimicrobia bacterium]|nr:HigA family addiction module antitoxin [Candidatus Neomarinimicrobiota bacterium]